MIVNGGDDGDVSRLPSPPFGICGAAAPQLSFCAHCATLWALSRIGVGGLQGCIQVSGVFRPKQVVSAGAQTDP